MTDMLRAGRRTWKCFAGFDVPQAQGPPGAAAARPPARGSVPCTQSTPGPSRGTRTARTGPSCCARRRLGATRRLRRRICARLPLPSAQLLCSPTEAGASAGIASRRWGTRGQSGAGCPGSRGHRDKAGRAGLLQLSSWRPGPGRALEQIRMPPPRKSGLETFFPLDMRKTSAHFNEQLARSIRSGEASHCLQLHC